MSVENKKYYLGSVNGQRRLLKHDDPHFKGVGVDFVSDQSIYRMKRGGGRSQAIAKAVGLKKGARPSVLDATAGLGRDAFVLASLGCRVHMVERSDIIFSLLEDGLTRALADPEIGTMVKERLSLQHAVSGLALSDMPFEPDVVYLDPMFPAKSKAAKVKKDMQVFQDILEGDHDASALLPWALEVAGQRVVVKQPAYAAPLNDQKSHTVIQTKKNRFDVYITRH